MNDKSVQPRNMGSVLALLAVSAALIWAILTNYLLALGLVALVLLGVLSVGATKDRTSTLNQTKLAVSILTFILVFGLGTTVRFVAGLMSIAIVVEHSEVQIKSYKAVIQPIDPLLKEFKITESVVLRGGEDIHLESRNVSAMRSRGLMLKEVHFAPLLAINGHVEMQLPSGRSFKGTLCPQSCVESLIELRGMPTGSFYEAKKSWRLSRSKYLDSETVVWSDFGLDEDIAFTYVPSRYTPFLKILGPLIGLSTVGQIVWTLFLIAVVPALSTVFGALLSDFAKKRVKAGARKIGQLIAKAIGAAKRKETGKKKGPK